MLGSCEAVVREARPKPVKPEQGFYREPLGQFETCEEAGLRVPGSEFLSETGGPPLLIVAAASLLLSGAPCSLSVRR